MSEALSPIRAETDILPRRALPMLPKGADPAAMQKVAIEFEATFLGQMLQTMFEGLSSDGPFSGGHAEKVYRGLLVEEYGKVLAKNGSIGIADAVLRTMLGPQEVK